MKITTCLMASALGALLLTGPALAMEQNAGGQDDDAGQPSLDTGPVDSEAMAILGRMAERLAGAEGFSVSIRSGYDVVQETGQKIEFGEQRRVILSRPGGLRVAAEQSDGDRRVIVFDGTTISVLDPDQNVYAQVENTGSVDDAVRYLVRDLQVRVPLAVLLVTSLPDDLTRRIESLDYVEHDRLTEAPTDHLAGRTADVDFQIWIAREGEPLPRRVVITYKHADGQPQFWAVLSDWKLSPEVPAAELAFTPPPGAERIPFVMRVPKGDTFDINKSEPEGGRNERQIFCPGHCRRHGGSVRRLSSRRC